jgi:hypothetical protein
VSARPDVLRRLVRALASIGLFRHPEPDLVELTPMGAGLSRTHPESLRDMALYFMETHYLPFSEPLHTACTGEVAAQRYLGRPFFDWIVEDRERVEMQNRAMARNVRSDMFTGYRLPEGRVVADIGGSDGTVHSAVLASRRDGIPTPVEHFRHRRAAQPCQPPPQHPPRYGMPERHVLVRGML